jgi:prevent-host-death family protein
MTAVQEVGMREELGVAELKRRFSELLNRVELKGERIEIRRRGRPVAALVPLAEIEEADVEGDRPKRGLAAAAGVWEDFQDVDGFLTSVRPHRGDRGDGTSS